MPSWLCKKLARIVFIVGAVLSWSFANLLFFGAGFLVCVVLLGYFFLGRQKAHESSGPAV